MDLLNIPNIDANYGHRPLLIVGFTNEKASTGSNCIYKLTKSTQCCNETPKPLNQK
ncbi:MAG: hypothetical protein ACI9FN_003615 [Saprospiraceae bacterium]|jgi:hypothetical protein